MTTLTPLQAIERLIDTGNDCWESIVTLAQSAEYDTFLRRFLLGDLALLVQREYGKNRISEYATKAGIARSTANQYRNMSAFYPEDMRGLFPNLNYSHFRTAMRLKDKAVEFLEECSSREYTVEAAQMKVKERLGKPLPPAKLLDVEGCVESAANGRLVIFLEAGIDYIDQLINRQVHVKLYEVEE